MIKFILKLFYSHPPFINLNNSTILLYNLLKTNFSILIITYGYSGVGKTFTVFGNKDNSGLLQTSLNNLGSNIRIKVKTFEIYGIALPYTSYWENKKPEEYEVVPFP